MGRTERRRCITCIASSLKGRGEDEVLIPKSCTYSAVSLQLETRIIKTPEFPRTQHMLMQVIKAVNRVKRKN